MVDPRTKPWDRGTKQRRDANAPRALRRVLILCEDTKSSVLYFKKFKVNPREIVLECVGTGMNTDSLVAEAIKRKKNAADARKPYQQIWVVFDKDSFPEDNFRRTRDLAAAHHEITLCWSNECFELWYLLHFDFRDTPVDRHALGGQISEKIGVPYDKASDGTYGHLEKHLQKALQNGKKLEVTNQKVHGDRYRNRSTRVHRLVELLLKFAEDRDAGAV